MSEILEERPEVEVGFFGTPITNDAEADAALKVIQEKEDETAYWDGYYADQLQKIRLQNQVQIENEKARLLDYFRRVPHRETKTQETYTLPHGKLVWKDQDPEYERDNAAIVSYLKANGKAALVKVKEEPDWKNLKATLKFNNGEAFDAETGEKVPGIKVKDRDRIFTIGK